MANSSNKLGGIPRHHPHFVRLMCLLGLDPEDSDEVFGFALALSSIRIVSDLPDGDPYEDLVERRLRDVGTSIVHRYVE